MAMITTPGKSGAVFGLLRDKGRPETLGGGDTVCGWQGAKVGGKKGPAFGRRCRRAFLTHDAKLNMIVDADEILQ
jgi:hypothetical protein